MADTSQLMGQLSATCIGCINPRDKRSKLHQLPVNTIQNLFGKFWLPDDPDLDLRLCTMCLRMCTNFEKFRDKFKENVARLKSVYEKETGIVQNSEKAETSGDDMEGVEIMPFADIKSEDEEKEEKHKIEEKDDPTISPPDVEEVAEVESEAGQQDETEPEDRLDETNENPETAAVEEESSSDLAPYPFLHLECIFCSEKMDHLNQYTDHLTEHSEEDGSYSCPQCPGLSKFTSADLFRQHVFSEHTQFKFHCPKCPVLLLTLHNAKIHMRGLHKISNDLTFRQCFICGQLADDSTELREHLNQAHIQPNQKDCFICLNVLPTDRQLAQHLYSHAYKRNCKCVCEICGKVFAMRQQLVNHQKAVHATEKHECDICHKKYSTSCYLARHRLTHTTERTLPCDQCEKLFFTENQLYAHKRTHVEANRTYICSYCGKACFNKGVLMEHVRIKHTFERLHPCDQCDRSYYRRRELVEHQRSHTGEKPFTCEVCGRVYARKTTLATHMKTHRQEKS